MNNHVFVVADSLLHYEQRTLEYRAAAYKALLDADIIVWGVVTERREADIYIAIWQRGITGSHSADVELGSFASGNPTLFRHGLIVTQTELIDGEYKTVWKEFESKA